MTEELHRKSVLLAARLKTMQECPELKEVDRHTLCSMVKKIVVFEDHRIEMEFYYTDQYHMIQEAGRNGQSIQTR